MQEAHCNGADLFEDIAMQMLTGIDEALPKRGDAVHACARRADVLSRFAAQRCVRRAVFDEMLFILHGMHAQRACACSNRELFMSAGLNPELVGAAPQARQRCNC